ncbi:hypothetical protein [Chondromyces crocatus]|uniref:hypothetical protein n=1 Tax=Chondromyces crocatus TaxID=52 RepID=UPI00067C0E75|nr:hypothetical protein [Chondromyces crocatus]
MRVLIRDRLLVANLWQGKGKTYGDTSASGYDYALAQELVRTRVPDGEILAALAARGGAHGRDAAYLLRTLDAARRSRGA